ncbi:Uncharacterized protein APZ42_029970, partial [Daphnia magna]
LFLTSLLALSFLAPSVAFNATVCNCDTVVNPGFLKFNEGECAYQATPKPLTPIMYAVYSSIPDIKRFTGHTCISHSRKPIKVDEAMCLKMTDSRQCRGKDMDISGPNTFAQEGYTFVETTLY